MCVARSSLLEALILAYFFGFIDRTVEDMTGNRLRERGSYMQQRDPSWQSNPRVYFYLFFFFKLKVNAIIIICFFFKANASG